MKKVFISLVLFVFTLTSYAVTFSQAKEVFRKLEQATGIKKPKLYLYRTNEVNAYRDGNNIVIYSGMLRFIKNQDELAMVLGHELAHYALGHNRSTYNNEYAADLYGANYTVKAGYNRCRGAKLILRFNDGASNDHPASSDRYNRIKC